MRRRRRLSLPGTILIVGLISACGEDAPDTEAWVESEVTEARERLTRDDAAQRVLDVIEEHGGLEAWYAAPTSAYTWEYSNLGANMRFESYLVADNRTRQVYHDLRSFGTPDSVEDVEARFAWDGERAWMSPGGREQPRARFWALTGYYFQSIPFVLADPGVRFRLLPPEEIDGVAYDRVMSYFQEGVGDSPGDVYVLYLDPETDRLAALLYTVTYGQPYELSPAGPEPPASGTLLFYEDYVTVDGLTVPTRFRGYEYQDGERGSLRNEAWVSEISFRERFDASLLEMPDDARVDDSLD